MVIFNCWMTSYWIAFIFTAFSINFHQNKLLRSFVTVHSLLQGKTNERLQSILFAPGINVWVQSYLNYLRMRNRRSLQTLYIWMGSIIHVMHKCIARWDNSGKKNLIWISCKVGIYSIVSINLFPFRNNYCILIAFQSYLFHTLPQSVHWVYDHRYEFWLICSINFIRWFWVHEGLMDFNIEFSVFRW
jgi:hypothetical protein